MCAWNGEMGPGSPEATIYVLMSNALLDLALADEMRDGSAGEKWRYVLSLLQIETNVARLWLAQENDPVWDDVRTPGKTETMGDIISSAFTMAVEQCRERFGGDINDWAWGRVRPFVLRHFFAGGDGMLGSMLNSKPLPGAGGVETVFKNHFARSDREKMKVAVGPAMRINLDMADPWAGIYTYAGGESGWPKSPHYADQLGDWMAGKFKALTPPATKDDTVVVFVPMMIYDGKHEKENR
jgi:penicillin amidase